MLLPLTSTTLRCGQRPRAQRECRPSVCAALGVAFRLRCRGRGRWREAHRRTATNCTLTQLSQTRLRHMKYIVVMWCIPSEEYGRPLCPPSSPPRIMSIFWFSLPLVLLPLVSGSLLHRHAALGGPKGHRCALTRMEESEAARPLMEPARNVISCARRFTQCAQSSQSALVAGLGVLSAHC